ncbi:BamA/TamA family outer membrane protein [Alphaproteobacteria bacterium]|nr:BamA/TamA family outer membrane protein [Alphaproteobacteria bacterium]
MDLFSNDRDFSTESSFDRSSLGAGLRFGYDITEKLSQSWRYQFSRDEVTNVTAGASSAIREQEGSSVKSTIGQSLTYDTRDSRVDPTEGFLARFSIDFAGLGGSVKHVRNRIAGVKYFPITEQIIANLSGEAGVVAGLGERTRIIDRFYLGGRNLRGFTNFGAGPRDIVTNDAIGGLWIYSGSAQVAFPMGLPNELGIRGRVFSDIGSSGSSDTSFGTIRDTKSLRAAVGVGLSWKSPFGPIAFDISKVVKKEDFDETELVRFDFGARF